MNNDKILKDFLAKDKAAELGGGTRKIEKQHQAGRMTARERIETLLDKGTFVEFDKLSRTAARTTTCSRRKFRATGSSPDTARSTGVRCTSTPTTSRSSVDR